MLLRRMYRLRLKTSHEIISKSNSNCVLLYFKGEIGLTQTIRIVLNRLRQEILEENIELLDVGNVNPLNEVLLEDYSII